MVQSLNIYDDFLYLFILKEEGLSNWLSGHIKMSQKDKILMFSLVFVTIQTNQYSLGQIHYKMSESWLISLL